MDLIAVKRALLSVSDKEGLPEFAKGLAGAGVELLSTGGTAKLLREHDIPVKDVSEVTGFPECLDGRVKTLHPNIHAGLLADRKNPSHLSQATELGVGLIDLVVVNLYPFDKAAEVPGRTRDDLTEQIDIGGPTMLRAAAKNCDSVAVVCDPADYGTILESITGSGITKDQSRDLAAKVFHHTAAYDAAISQAMREPRLRALPERWALGLIKESNLRYGENPHQLGAFYRAAGKPAEGLSALKQFQGKGLSYNNYLDMDAAYRLAAAFDDPTAVVVKHQNPCGVGFHDDMAQAFARAFAADTVSAFGGVVALNRPLTAAAAEKMKGIFLEVIVAPEVDSEALEVLGKKKNLRVVQAPPSLPPHGVEVRAAMGGWLVQSVDGEQNDVERSVVTERQPSDSERIALERAWTMVRYVRSNAIVLGDREGILGLGCGQTNRVDAVRHATDRLTANEIVPKDVVLASDAFFPFRDGVDAAAEAGATAIIQPGGSVRDEEVIAAANEHGMAMVFTGRRSFRH